jgi:hypothetical protein
VHLECLQTAVYKAVIEQIRFLPQIPGRPAQGSQFPGRIAAQKIPGNHLQWELQWGKVIVQSKELEQEATEQTVGSRVDPSGLCPERIGDF